VPTDDPYPDAWSRRHYERLATDPVYAARYARRRERVTRQTRRAMAESVALMHRIIAARMAAAAEERAAVPWWRRWLG
jgi:hypothetical protein